MNDELQQIDKLCDQFETDLRQGIPVSIEDVLAKTPVQQRERLLRELLEIELELAAQQPEKDGESHTQPILALRDSLKQRFPDQQELIDSIVQRVAKLRQIGDYEILEELGHGGMGIVFKARQQLLNQTVAIKVLSQTLLDDGQAVARFRREMQLIGRLNHPNIVRALNAGTAQEGPWEGSHYLVMEFIDGITLQKLGNLRHKNMMPGTMLPNKVTHESATHKTSHDGDSEPTALFQIDPQSPPTYLAGSPAGFPFAAACEVIRQAALGLQHAHEFGLVHRDIKPANLMVGHDGVVKLLDLGLGKFLDEHRTPGEHTSLTLEGTTIGTIDYISPEQCENAGDVDIRADIYSLGCTFFFLLTGKPLYSGSRYDTTRKKLMAHIVGDIPKLRSVIPDAPPELEALFEKMLAKDPEERFSTPVEVADALTPFASFDALLAMMEVKTLDGSRSLSYPTKTSVTKTQIHHPNPKLSRRVLALYLVAAISGLTAVSFSLHQFFTKSNRISKEQFQNLLNEREAKDAEILLASVRTDLTMLPGLNGQWWFDEIPWYLPPVRSLLSQKITSAKKGTELLGEDPKFYYASDISKAEAQLWNIVQKILAELPEHQQNIVQKIHDFQTQGLEFSSEEKCYQECLDLLSSASEAGDLHTRALLEHRLALLRNDRDLAKNAASRYAESVRGYENSLTDLRADDAARFRLLTILCKSDAARLESFASGNADQAIQKFEDVLANRLPGDRVGTLFRTELNLAYGALCTKSGKFNDTLFKDALSWLERAKLNLHPFVAICYEKYAWSLLAQWKLAEARDLFARATGTRFAILQSGHAFTQIRILEDLYGSALTNRYRGDTNLALQEFRDTLKRIQDHLAKLPSDRGSLSPSEQKRTETFRAELLLQSAKIREGLADCTLFAGAAAGQFGPARLTEAAKLYEEAASMYDQIEHHRMAACKQALVLLLQEDTEKAQSILDRIGDVEKSLPATTSSSKYAQELVSLGNKMGEGWLLCGEMLELIHQGVPNIVCTQPFGC